MNPGAAAVAAFMIMHAEDEEREEEERERVKDRLGLIVQEGMDESKWIVDCGRNELPVYEQGFLAGLFGYKSHHKRPSEPRDAYLGRALHDFDLYLHTHILIAKRKELALFFDWDEESTSKEQREVTLFRPCYTDLPEIKAEMEVRTHARSICYGGFGGRMATDLVPRVYAPGLIEFRNGT